MNAAVTDAQIERRARKAGLAALLQHPNIEQIAKVNAFDHFILVAAPPVESAIVGVIDLNVTEETEWLVAYLNDAPKWTDGRWSECRSAYKSPFNLAICRTAYDALRNQGVPA